MVSRLRRVVRVFAVSGIKRAGFFLLKTSSYKDLDWGIIPHWGTTLRSISTPGCRVNERSFFNIDTV
jgi:hypothetical protein